MGRGKHAQGWEKKYSSTCLFCCKEFSHAKKTVMYCSLHCGDNFRYLINLKRPKVTSNCVVCDKEFTHVMRFTASCSPVCRSKKRYNEKKLERLNI